MSVGNWQIISGNIQGDISYEVKKTEITSSYVDFEIIMYSERWDNVDISIEYRLNSRDMWQTDTSIVASSSKYIKNNKIYGLLASKYGSSNFVRWQYVDNKLFYSYVPEIKISIMPKLRNYNQSISNHSISTIYSDSLVDISNSTSHNCIGIDNNGKYICLGLNSIYIMDSI